MKGTVQKFETLQDGSVKLSIYVNKELINEAVTLAYQEVDVCLLGKDRDGVGADKTEILTGIKSAMERMVDLLATLEGVGDAKE